MRIPFTKNSRILFFPGITLSPDELRASRRRSAWIWILNLSICASGYAYFSYRGNEWGQFLMRINAIMSAIACIAIARRARA